MTGIILNFIISWFLTIAIESAAAFMIFRIRGKEQLLLVLINTMTNPAAVLICMMLSVYAGIPFYCSVLLTEAAVFLTEGVLFRQCMPECPHPLRTAFSLNLASFGCGLVLSVFL